RRMEGFAALVETISTHQLVWLVPSGSGAGSSLLCRSNMRVFACAEVLFYCQFRRHQEGEMIRRLTASLAASLLISAGPALAQGGGAPAKAKATTPEIPFEAVNFLKMPDGLYMGEAVGVATNSKGHVFVSTRSGESRV